MKSLTHICEGADQILGFLETTSGQLEKEAKQWIDDSFKIIAHRVSVKNHNLMIVTESDGKYDVLCFFPVGKKWNASADQTNKTLEEVTQYLLNNFE